MDRFKSSGFRRLIIFLLLLSSSFLYFSCSNYKKIKIEIFDSNNTKLSNYEISIVGYLDKRVEENEDLILNLKKQEYLIRIYKDNYFPYENVFDLKKINNIVIKIRNINEGIDEINDKFISQIKNLNNYYVDFTGKVDNKDITFTAFFDFDKNIIKVNSKYLNKEVTINKVDSKYFYNETDLPEETQKYFGEIIKIIQDSVIYIKDLPIEINNRRYRSSNGYIIIDFEEKNINLEINGYIILDGFNFGFKNENIYIKTIDEMKRVSEFNLNFYIK